MIKNPDLLKDFIKSITYFQKKYFVDKIILFGYYLQQKENYAIFTINDITECFTITFTPKPANFTDLFNKLEAVNKIIPEKEGWVLSAVEIDEIEQNELGGMPMISIKDELKVLPEKLPEVQQKFVNEILGCLKVQAWRGAIVLTWILTLDHLQKIVLEKKLETFNSLLLENEFYKKITISKISDFEEIKDADFLRVVRSCGIIGKNQLDILENRLKERNRYAHPTDLELTDTMVIAFIEDLLHNIILKINTENV